MLLGYPGSVDSLPSLFTPIDKHQRLFQRRPAPITLPATLPDLLRPGRPFDHQLPNLAERRAPPGTLAEVHEQLLAHYAPPPSVLINHEYEIARISRGGRRYLELTGRMRSRPGSLKLIHRPCASSCARRCFRLPSSTGAVNPAGAARPPACAAGAADPRARVDAWLGVGDLRRARR